LDLIFEGIVEAIRLIFSGDTEVLGVTLLSLLVSGSATVLSLLIGVPFGTLMALTNFRGRQAIVSLINTGMGLPPVVVGLIVMIFLWRNGPFGFLSILYSPVAMVIAQCVIASPIIAGLTMASLQQLNPKLRLQILALGANRWQMILLLLREARLPLLAAIMAGFGAIISEIGASQMVGGNIKGSTRVLTTATAMESSKGNFGTAIALGIILMGLVYAVNYILTTAQQRSHPQ
jgi:tungstate transport system permease protein